MARKPTCECGNCSKCKHRAYMRRYVRANPDQARKARERARRHRAANLEQIRERDRARGFRPSSPEAIAARRATKHLRREPCVICGEVSTEAHHPDYSRPLLVVWLCPPHHRAIHQEVHPDFDRTAVESLAKSYEPLSASEPVSVA